MYLFEDAARSKRNDLFSGVSKNGNLTYSEICEVFDERGIEIFCDNIKERFIKEEMMESVYLKELKYYSIEYKHLK